MEEKKDAYTSGKIALVPEASVHELMSLRATVYGIFLPTKYCDDHAPIVFISAEVNKEKEKRKKKKKKKEKKRKKGKRKND